MTSGLRSPDDWILNELRRLRKDVDTLSRIPPPSLVSIPVTTSNGKPVDALFTGIVPMVGAYVYDTSSGKPWWRYDVDDWRDATGSP